MMSSTSRLSPFYTLRRRGYISRVSSWTLPNSAKPAASASNCGELGNTATGAALTATHHPPTRRPRPVLPLTFPALRSRPAPQQQAVRASADKTSADRPKDAHPDRPAATLARFVEQKAGEHLCARSRASTSLSRNVQLPHRW